MIKVSIIVFIIIYFYGWFIVYKMYKDKRNDNARTIELVRKYRNKISQAETEEEKEALTNEFLLRKNRIIK